MIFSTKNLELPKKTITFAPSKLTIFILLRMKKTLLSLMASAITLASATTAMAEGSLYLGYCDGQIAAQGSGLTGSNATISEAIRIPASTLASYVGCQISGINAGMTNSSAYPEQLVGWISATQDGEKLATSTLDAPGKGWNTISLDTPYTITGQEEELWIGFDFVQSKKLSVISFVGESNPDGAFVAKNGKYTDYSTKGLGCLSLEAIVTGETLPVHDLTITSLRTVFDMTQIGEPIKTRVALRNNASADAVNPVIEYALNGQTVGTYTYPGTLAYRESANIALEIPTDGINKECEVEISVKASWADGIADDAPADNEAKLIATMVESVFYRTMVAEEGTGSWCGWCVRGLVGMKYMRETYPDQFIGIGVHNGDEYAVKAYDSWMSGKISGYPSAIVNRDGKVYDPNAQELERTLQAMNALAAMKIEPSVTFNADSTKITVHTNTQFLVNNSAANYNVVYVVLEDKLPISQHNYYSGGGNGAMGGFEDMPSTADIEIDDVARGVYPAPAGQSGIIPEQIAAKEVYEYDYELELPVLNDLNNAWLAVLLIDNNNRGEIVQAAKCDLIKGEGTGIRNLATEHRAVRAYDMMGRETNAKGIQIRGGQVTFIR